MTEPAILYMAPQTCARVTAMALEKAGVAYEMRAVRFVRGEHKSAAYKALNPVGKVPTLATDAATLRENVAIICYLDERYPQAGLMPAARDAADRARNLADLCFCSATLHPLVTRIRLPALFAAPEHSAEVKQRAEAAMDEHFDLIERRLENGPWWYGDDWSAMDAYLHWIYWRVEGAGYARTGYPRFRDHAARCALLPHAAAAIAREEEVQALLAAEGTAFDAARFVGGVTGRD